MGIRILQLWRTKKGGSTSNFLDTWLGGMEDKVQFLINNSMCYSLSTYPQKLKYITAKGDSAFSGHCWRDENAQWLKNIKLQLGPQVTLPNNSSIQVTKQGYLPLDPSLTKKPTSVAILPYLKIASLAHLVQLCDNDCEVLLEKKN